MQEWSPKVLKLVLTGFKILLGALTKPRPEAPHNSWFCIFFLLKKKKLEKKKRKKISLKAAKEKGRKRANFSQDLKRIIFD